MLVFVGVRKTRHSPPTASYIPCRDPFFFCIRGTAASAGIDPLLNNPLYYVVVLYRIRGCAVCRAEQLEVKYGYEYISPKQPLERHEVFISMIDHCLY